MTPLELLLILLLPFTVLGIHAHRQLLRGWLKAAWRKAEAWTRPPSKQRAQPVDSLADACRCGANVAKVPTPHHPECKKVARK